MGRAIDRLRRPKLAVGRQDASDYGDVIQRSGRNRDHEVVGLVVGQGQATPVHSQEREGRGERQAFVAIHERVVAREGVQQGRGFVLKVRVGVTARRARPAQSRRRPKAPLTRTSTVIDG